MTTVTLTLLLKYASIICNDYKGTLITVGINPSDKDNIIIVCQNENSNAHTTIYTRGNLLKDKKTLLIRE